MDRFREARGQGRGLSGRAAERGRQLSRARDRGRRLLGHARRAHRYRPQRQGQQAVRLDPPQRYLAPNGDIGPTRDKGLAYPYPISWVVEGAHRLGQFDVSQRGMDFIMTLPWDPESGGFYSTPGDFGPDGKQDLWVISSLGRAALYTGRVDVGRAVGGWMRRLMDLQPNYPAQMHTVYSRAKGIHTEADPGDDVRRYVFNLDATTDERFLQSRNLRGLLGAPVHGHGRGAMAGAVQGVHALLPQRLRLPLHDPARGQDRLGPLRCCTR